MNVWEPVRRCFRIARGTPTLPAVGSVFFCSLHVICRGGGGRKKYEVLDGLTSMGEFGAVIRE